MLDTGRIESGMRRIGAEAEAVLDELSEASMGRLEEMAEGGAMIDE